MIEIFQPLILLEKWKDKELILVKQNKVGRKRLKK